MQLFWSLAFVVLWSSGFVGAVLAGDTDPAGVLAWRYVITAVLLLVVVAVRRPRLTLREVGQQAALGVLAHVVFLGGVFGAAAAGLGAGTTALVCALQPMLVTALGWAWWGDRLSGRTAAGLLTGLVAVAATVGGATWGAAVLLPVASLLGLSGAALLERRWRPSGDVLGGLAVQVLVAAAVFTAYAGLGGHLQVPVTGRLVAAVAWLVVLSGLGGYVAFLVCLRHLGAGRTSALLYLTPPVTTLWAWAMFAEVPGPAQLLGLGLGVVAVALVSTGVDRD